MVKVISSTLLLCGCLITTALEAGDDFSAIFQEGKVSAQIREFTIMRSYKFSDSAKSDYTRKANAIGGHLKYETADIEGVSFAAALYTTNGFALDDAREDYTKVDPTLLGKDNRDYSILGEAYLNYSFKNTTFRAGRQKLDTPLAGGDDARMLPNLFEAYLLSSKELSDTTFIIGHVSKFAQGTFGRVYDGGILSATSGYSLVDSRNKVGEFTNMGRYAIGKETDGVSVASLAYRGVSNLKVQLWDYYAYDILNALYGEINYSLKVSSLTPYVAAQIIRENAVGDKLAGELSGLYAAVKLGMKVVHFNLYGAYSQTTENSVTDANTKNAIITPWGGMAAYTQGMVTRHMYLAGTKAYKLSAMYDWKEFSQKLSTAAYYTYFNMDKNNGYTYGDASEMGFDLIYYPSIVKNLQLRLRGNFTNDFNVAQTTLNTTEWDEYRFIVNYNF